MATSFGNSKSTPPKGRSVDDILQLYQDNEEALNHHLAKMKTTALTELSTQWFMDNPLTVKTMTDWGQILCPYVERISSSMDKAKAKPLAEYLNFVSTLDVKQLIPGGNDRRSPRYDAFCELLMTLTPATIHNAGPAWSVIAKEGMVDLHGLMAKMESMRKRQTSYDEYVLDNPGEYSEIPAGVMMHALIGLSLHEQWKIPKDDKMYHNAWEVLTDEDLECFTEEDDIIGHLTKVLPTSTYEALDYYKYKDHHLSLEQKQQILGMSIAHLDFENDFELLVEVLYYNEFGNDEDVQKIFAAINPAANVLATLIALYDSPQEVISDLVANPHLQEMVLAADKARNIENADALIATLEM